MMIRKKFKNQISNCKIYPRADIDRNLLLNGNEIQMEI